MKKIDDLLEPALALAAEYLLEDGKMDRRSNSDISSFGTAIMQCGLIPAVAMYSNVNSDAGKRHLKMLYVIFALLRPDENGGTPTVDEIEKTTRVETDHPLFLNMLLDKGVDRDKTELVKWRRNTMQACIALKLAVRTFRLEEVHDERS
ncbi:MAG: hypothetical protein M1378_06260 [Bacteroidetes bacterium]|nr:hypothetical protein [Bacteroidota bacterium]